MSHKDQIFYLSEILENKVFWRNKKIGRLDDLIIVENNHFPEVVALCVSRPFGNKMLIIPWQNIETINKNEVVISIDAIQPYESESKTDALLLKDHILDKKVLDIEGREVEVVYDIKLQISRNKLYVSEVNISHYRLLRRLGLKWLANAMVYLSGDQKDVKIPWDYIQPLPENIGSFSGNVKLKILKEKLSDIHPADMADILEELDHNQRVLIFNELETGHASDTLEEIDPAIQRDLVPSLKKERVAQLLNDMTPGQAADILSVLPLSERTALIKLLHPKNITKVASIIEQQEENVVNFITDKIIICDGEQTVKQTRDNFFNLAKGKEALSQIYVVDNLNNFLGVIGIKELAQKDEQARLKNEVIDNVVSLRSSDGLKDAMAIFSHYYFSALPVVDENNKLLGVIPYRDVMNLKHLFWG